MEQDRGILEKWKPGKEKLLLIFLMGCLLVLFSAPAGPGEKKGSPERSTEALLEERIQEILSHTEGVGQVDVILMRDEGEETFSGYHDRKEKITGVVISAEGAGSALVRSEISSDMVALFGLPPHKIKVLKRVRKGDV